MSEEGREHEANECEPVEAGDGVTSEAAEASRPAAASTGSSLRDGSASCAQILPPTEMLPVGVLHPTGHHHFVA